MKKCVMCGEDAKYVIKDTADAYCEECAVDCFNDVSFLQKIEEQAQQLKELVKDRIEEELEGTEHTDIESEDNLNDK